MYTQYKKKTDKELKKLISISDFYVINEFGERLFKEEKYEEALNYFEKASDLGSNMAINNIGFYYLEIENNLEIAEKYFLKAMKKGNIIALNNLGMVNDRKENYNRAIEYYLMAIKKKCNFAYNNLGNLECIPKFRLFLSNFFVSFLYAFFVFIRTCKSYFTVYSAVIIPYFYILVHSAS